MVLCSRIYCCTLCNINKNTKEISTMGKFNIKIHCLMLTCFILFGCVTIQDRWKATKAEDTVEAYNTFLKQNSENEFKNAAKKRIEELEWINTKSKNTVMACEEFLRKYPYSIFGVEAKERVNENKAALKRATEAALAKINTYKTGVTTEEIFKADGWSIDKVINGSVGIIGCSKKNGGNTYELGYAPVTMREYIANDDGLVNWLEECIETKYFPEMILTAKPTIITVITPSYQGGITTYGVDDIEKVCTLKFEENMLTSITRH